MHGVLAFTSGKVGGVRISVKPTHAWFQLEMFRGSLFWFTIPFLLLKKRSLIKPLFVYLSSSSSSSLINWLIPLTGIVYDQRKHRARCCLIHQSMTPLALTPFLTLCFSKPSLTSFISLCRGACERTGFGPSPDRITEHQCPLSLFISPRLNMRRSARVPYAVQTSVLFSLIPLSIYSFSAVCDSDRGLIKTALWADAELQRVLTAAWAFQRLRPDPSDLSHCDETSSVLNLCTNTKESNSKKTAASCIPE